MKHFDFTRGGLRRPTVAMIVRAWKDAGRPMQFTASYGETFAEFGYGGPGQHWTNGWQASGNGCRGIERDKVAAALNALMPNTEAA